MYERLLNIFNAAGSPRVLLVGDFMLDHYILGNTDRISPEAPVIVMNVTERLERPGGAGSVAANLAALDVEVACLGIVGDDHSGRLLGQLLTGLGSVNIDALISLPDRPTTTKQRIIGLAQHRHRQQLMRIDEECCNPIAASVRDRFDKKLKALIDWCDVVCLEDYNKGLLCNDFCKHIIRTACDHHKHVIVDPAAITDYSRYHGVWMIKPNRRELASATGIDIDGPDTWESAAGSLAQDHNIANVVVTLDKQGAYLYRKATDANAGSGELIPTRPRNVYDVTGAGDMVLALLALLTAAKYKDTTPPTISETVCLANVAGGLEVERFGSVGLSRNEIIGELSRQRRIKTGKLRSLNSLLQELTWLRRQKMNIVFTNGCFDILHPGHINLLSFAKEQGDILIVAINSDDSVRNLKGSGRPILKQHDRAALLSALEAVDYILVFDEPTPLHLIEQVSPDILIKGSDWAGSVVGQEWVEAHDGKVVLMPLSKGISTTNIIERVIQQNAKHSSLSGEPS